MKKFISYLMILGLVFAPIAGAYYLPDGTDTVPHITTGKTTVADGGTVTQVTSITTGVTLNTLSGQITTVSAGLATGVDATFTVTNSKVVATDVVICSTGSYAGTADGIPVCQIEQVGAGSFDVNIRNTGAATLDAVIVLNYVVIGGESS